MPDRARGGTRPGPAPGAGDAMPVPARRASGFAAAEQARTPRGPPPFPPPGPRGASAGPRPKTNTSAGASGGWWRCSGWWTGKGGEYGPPRGSVGARAEFTASGGASGDVLVLGPGFPPRVPPPRAACSPSCGITVWSPRAPDAAAGRGGRKGGGRRPAGRVRGRISAGPPRISGAFRPSRDFAAPDGAVPMMRMMSQRGVGRRDQQTSWAWAPRRAGCGKGQRGGSSTSHLRACSTARASALDRVAQPVTTGCRSRPCTRAPRPPCPGRRRPTGSRSRGASAAPVCGV